MKKQAYFEKNVPAIPTMPYFLSFAAGAMIYTTIEEIPQISLKGDNDNGSLAFAIGFALVMLMVFMGYGMQA